MYVPESDFVTFCISSVALPFTKVVEILGPKIGFKMQTFLQMSWWIFYLVERAFLLASK